ncbi:MAG TPA: PEGA domain-containing protein [Pyrinomonadaceae bacterium]|jgi:hypothetical protein
MNSSKRIATLLLLCLTVSFAGYPQENKNKEQEPKTATIAPPPPKNALEFGLSEDTPVRIKLTRTISSKDAKVDDKVDFEVLEDIKVKDVVVIRQGAMAIATVTKAQPKRRLGRSGKLDMNIDYVQLVDGEKVPLRAVKGGSGGNHTTAMTSAIVATSILFFPAAPLFLFMKGKNITIPQGTEVTAYIAADTPLDPAKFTQAALSNSAAPPMAASPDSSVTIKSSPEGADITVDDKFVGTTPSTIHLSPGEHKITVVKPGYKPWERTMSVTANGSISLSAELEKLP